MGRARGLARRGHVLLHRDLRPAEPLLDKPTSWKRWSTADRDPVDRWGEGRATLLGDAAHPMLQYLAQGACIALEDAVTLREALRATGRRHRAGVPALRVQAHRARRTADHFGAGDGTDLSRQGRRAAGAQLALEGPHAGALLRRARMALRLDARRGACHERGRELPRRSPRPPCRSRAPARRIPVRRIHCVGRNYAAHIREMGFDPEREPPFFFAKPADAIVPNGATIRYPLATSNFAYEIELVVAIGKRGVNIQREAALDHVFGYAVGLDMTRRDLQLAARDRGRPWEPGKAFDESAPITAIHPASRIGHPEAGRIWLKVNGETQAGRRSQAARLAGAGHHRVPVAAVRAASRRPDLHRHAGRRRAGPARRRDARRRRGRRRAHDPRGGVEASGHGGRHRPRLIPRPRKDHQDETIEGTARFGGARRGRARAAGRGPAVSHQAGPRHHAVPRRQRARLRRPPRRRQARPWMGPAGDRREPAGRERVHRDRGGEEGGARRLHAGPDGRRAHGRAAATCTRSCPTTSRRISIRSRRCSAPTSSS